LAAATASAIRGARLTAVIRAALRPAGGTEARAELLVRLGGAGAHASIARRPCRAWNV
jgi:hypothetical protein